MKDKPISPAKPVISLPQRASRPGNPFQRLDGKRVKADRVKGRGRPPRFPGRTGGR